MQKNIGISFFISKPIETKYPGIKIKVVDIDFAANPEDMSKLKAAVADVDKLRILGTLLTLF